MLFRSDVTITMAAEAGQLQLNVMEPVIAYSLFHSLKIMRHGFDALRIRCINGITANEDICRNYVLNSIGIVTALNPVLGYETSAAIAKEALETGGSVYDIVLRRQLVPKDKLDEILSPQNLMHPKFIQ